jgi:hypothetical protein
MDARQKFRRADRRFEQAIRRATRRQYDKRAAFWERAWGRCARIHREAYESKHRPWPLVVSHEEPMPMIPRHLTPWGVDMPRLAESGDRFGHWPIGSEPW